MSLRPTVLMLMLVAAGALSGSVAANGSDRVSMSLRDVDIAEAMAMLAKQQRLNILLSDGVSGTLSLNLYDVPATEAVKAIANAAGYAVERRDGAYFVLPHERVGLYNNSGLTQVRRFNVHYADPLSLAEMIEPYLSRYGKLQAIRDRKLILVSDTPEFLNRIALLVRHADAKPRQVIIQAQILEIALNDEDSYGIDWQKLFESQDGAGSFGSQGLAGAGGSGSSGFFFDFVNPNIDVLLTALEQDGRVRTLSTPKLVALDNQEAEVIIGDRRGYQVTTTINQVTSESIEFLESGVILRVTPHIDEGGQVLMDIHPEVSTGTVDAAGIPSQTTTEVTTSLLVPSGETVFIGGLMKHSTTQSYRRVPVLGRVPGLKILFSSKEETQVNTETVVLITPRIVDSLADPWNTEAVNKVEEAARWFEIEADRLEDRLDQEAMETHFGLGRADTELAAHTQDPEDLPPPADASADTPRVAGDAPENGPLTAEAIRDLPGDLYTVQLMTMWDPALFRSFLEEHDLTHLPSLELVADGRAHYALLMGVYESVTEARAALVHRPTVFADAEPWIRPLRSVQALMPSATDQSAATELALGGCADTPDRPCPG